MKQNSGSITVYISQFDSNKIFKTEVNFLADYNVFVDKLSRTVVTNFNKTQLLAKEGEGQKSRTSANEKNNGQARSAKVKQEGQKSSKKGKGQARRAKDK